jgi:predicted dithiol-disulfide oxidoreductase (DUF899 family)
MIKNEMGFENGNAPKVVSPEEWLAARKQLLAKEREFTHARDALNAQRRELPWVKVDKEYAFDTPEGKQTLAELFDGRRQLIINHFMLGPGWKEGCVGCSFGVDHIEGALVHLTHHDVTYVAVSRAPLAEIEPFKRRMGWNFRWVSSFASDFNFDYHVSFTPEEIAGGRIYYNYDWREARGEEGAGLSVFYKDDSGQIFHTYSSYGRGNEELLGTYVHLDITPKGRNENGPGFNLTDWVRHHDRYDHSGFVDRTGRYVAIAGATQTA